MFDIYIIDFCWKKNLSIHPSQDLTIWRRRSAGKSWLKFLLFPFCPQNDTVRKKCWSFCYALVSPSHAGSPIFPFPVGSLEIVLMLVFRVRKQQKFFQIGSCFKTKLVGVVWAVSSLPKQQLILVVPGSDLVLKWNFYCWNLLLNGNF